MNLDSNLQNDYGLLGFDVKSALALLGGSEELYMEILRRFFDDYGSVPTTLLSLSILTDKEELQRIAHTIKGLAATIGAIDLQLKAKSTEYAIQEGREPMLVTLSKALTECLEKIEGYLAQTEAFDNLESAPIKPTNEPDEKYTIARLIGELEKVRFIPEQELRRYEPVLCRSLDSNSRVKVLQAIQTLDYPSAIQILQLVPN